MKLQKPIQNNFIIIPKHGANVLNIPEKSIRDQKIHAIV